ncbi:hypothetical protein QQ045_017332 [Rhodiola kirilowii]
MSHYNRKSVSKRCTLKLDISKAYDMVDWKFLEASLPVFGFLTRFIKWIMGCISSAKFSMLINGNLEGFFGRAATRRSDPPPYLFTLVMEVLGRILGKASKSTRINLKFFGGCNEAEKLHLSSSSGLRVGRLPFHYLGVPLGGKSLKAEAYKTLLYRVTAKISCWSTK